MPEPVDSKAPGASPFAPGPRRWLRHLILATVLIALAVAAAFLPWAELLHTIAAADPFWLMLAALASLAIYPFWIWQWRLLIAPVARIRWETTAEVVFVSAAARSAASSVGGLASAAAMLNLRADVSLPATAGILAIDQALVGLAKLAILILALWLAALPWQVVAALLSLMGALAVLVALILLLRGEALRGLLPERLGGYAASLAEGLRLIDDPLRLTLATGLALVKKATEVATALAVQLAVGIEPSLAAAILTVAAVSLVTVVPLIPANLGVHSAGVYVVYEALGVGTAPALAAALLQHATVFLGQVIAGLGALALGRRAERRTAAGGAARDEGPGHAR